MGKKPRKFIVATLSISALFFYGGCDGSKTNTVRIGYLSNTGSLPLFVAEEKGFFTEEGIHEEATPIATSNQLVDALVAGNLDAYPESSAYPALAVELQSPGRLKIFSASAITKQKPFDSILVKDGSSIRSVSDLAGKRIGVFPGSTATSFLKKYLKDSHIDASGIVFVPVPPQTQLGALLEGSIDALHAYEPTTAIAGSRRSWSSHSDSIRSGSSPEGSRTISTISCSAFAATASWRSRVSTAARTTPRRTSWTSCPPQSAPPS
jgi:ABC-type nitrate/sulfonate/bicarbonate transport system substrate-binding protein